ncbi:MAG TPA: serine hydrolase, partial [Candidatus Baltobacteraceae bacterium]|nr:serine hydrolase [Candidatus Baltobacteraceae bacterium]
RLLQALVAIGGLSAVAATGMPSHPPVPSTDDALLAIDRYAPVAMANQQTPGLSVAITDRSKTLRVITLGYANVDAKTPVTAQTRFAIGSITKSMTALSIVQLRDEGRVSLDAPVKRYLPWFKIDAGGSPILVHQLLSHTAGIPDDYSLENSSTYDVAMLRDTKVLFKPGTSWSYSNDGFATLGNIVSAVDGRPWADVVARRVFTPIGMSDSAAVFTPQTLLTAALGYQWRDNDRPPTLDPVLVASPVMDFVDPAGSVLSTPEDMARYMRFYLNGGKLPDGRRLISAQSFTDMTTPDRLNDGKPAGSPGTELAEWPEFYRKYGFGLSVFDEGGDRLIGHTGGISGYTACMQMNLTRGFGVIAFANHVEAPLHPCAIVQYAMRVLRAQSAGTALPSPAPTPDPAHVAHANDYAGTYRSGNAELRVAAQGDKLSLIDGATTSTLYPRDTDQFWSDDPRFATYLLAFGRDANKRVVEMNYGSQWYTNADYRGPRNFSHPKAWDTFVGRYENVFLGQPFVTRAIVVKDRLTLDGVTPLRSLSGGRFAMGSSIVRFDTLAAGQTQRMTLDDAKLYRIGLP